jgi:glycosyltransferase involved in cell wall biosynthesis
LEILLIYNKIPFPAKDGGSIAVKNLAEGLMQNNCDVKMLCFNTNKHFVNEEILKDNIPKNIEFQQVFINTDIKNFKALKNLFLSIIPYNAERYISEEFEIKLVEILKNNNFDIIQIEGLYMMPYINTIRKYSEAKISFRAHNIEHEIWEKTSSQEKNILKKIYLKILFKRIKNFEKSFINQYDFLIPITERDQKQFQKFGNQKASIICPTGINTNEYKISEFTDDEDISIYSLGSLDWQPNIEGLIWFINEVWPKIIKENKEITLKIAGRNPSKELRKYFNKNNIIYYGEIENAKEFITSNKIMIVPLFSGSGMRIKILEAMASGNIVISTSKGAEGINAQNNKEILITNTSEEFIEAVKKIKENKISKKEISIAAHRFISENFDNFAISKALTKFYLNQIKD